MKNFHINSGLPNAVRTSHPSMRCMWYTSVLISTGICSYLVISSVLQYLDFEVITKVRVINEFESEFPRVLICNANEFTTNYSLNYLRDTRHLFSNYTLDQLDDPNFVAAHYKQALRYVTKFVDEEKMKLSHSLKETILKCQLDGKPCDYTEDFEWVYNDFHGNCFVFNSRKDKSLPLRYLKYPGKSHGLYVKMYVGNVRKEILIVHNLAIV